MMGDSKTSSANNTWPTDLAGKFADNLGVSGATVAWTATNISTILAGSTANTPGDVKYVLINLGANDGPTIPENPTETATWNSNYETIIDAAHVKFPGATVYLMRPWRADFSTAQADLLASRIDTIVAARPGLAFAGPDERVWLKGSDNGATNTIDGVHYSTAGEAACVTAWKSVITWP